ncbi:putative double-stranded RNA-binding domain-containing protein [Lupinus albus]|uniref:Putative double-stranded RNA-binding domain-containing protein n=1 Tax=Lupinus albus TaxID=3870 RepID=A0A6A4PTX4_LUPAL|nr:putative double-stranded RNA-binding domain-containing protein [Lupinus albus]
MILIQIFLALVVFFCLVRNSLVVHVCLVIAEEAMQKNKLQEFTQKYGLQLPEYRIVNEGFSHAPKFRSMVLVNGKEFKSRKTYTHRKDAEKDVAELALKSITQDIKNEKSTILPDLVYSKSILIEYAVKKNIENPQYKTTTEGVQHHVFSSTLKFNGKSYIGEVGKRKKEAEQLVAFAAIKSLLGMNL